MMIVPYLVALVLLILSPPPATSSTANISSLIEALGPNKLCSVYDPFKVLPENNKVAKLISSLIRFFYKIHNKTSK